MAIVPVHLKSLHENLLVMVFKENSREEFAAFGRLGFVKIKRGEVSLNRCCLKVKNTELRFRGLHCVALETDHVTKLGQKMTRMQ